MLKTWVKKKGEGKNMGRIENRILIKRLLFLN